MSRLRSGSGWRAACGDDVQRLVVHRASRGPDSYDKFVRMFERSIPGATSPAAELHAAVAALQRRRLDTDGDETLLELLRALEEARSRLAALDAAIVAQVQARGLAGQRACSTTASLLTQLLRVHPREAAARVRAAQDLGPRRALTGDRLEPVFPAVADALARGRISTRHAAVITRTVDALPPAVGAEQDRAVEQFLAAEAEQCNPVQLAILARRISDTLDPDGTLSDAEYRHRRRYLTVTQRADGSAHVQAELEPDCAEALLTVLDTLGRPKPAARADDTNGAAAGGDSDGDPLPRGSEVAQGEVAQGAVARARLLRARLFRARLLSGICAPRASAATTGCATRCSL